jgi:hypothetical protein
MSQSLPIFYDAALVAKGFPSPLVKARIAGHEALFIIDTGASVNVLADWYARLAEVPTTTTAGTATGSGGKTGCSANGASTSSSLGGEVSGRRIVRGVQLLRGGGTAALNPSIGEVAAPCDAKGLLGMDGLRSCLLILGDSEMAFSCD